jgi:isocitrate dehydrogenase
MKKIPVAIAEGDGIGPEIMKAVIRILDAAGAPLDYHYCEIGEKVYQKGFLTGIESKTWDTIRASKGFLKAPITTPQGGGFKSLNVTIRTTLGLYANVRPCTAFAPFVKTKHPGMDVVIIRENEEDLYTGIEYRQTPECTHAIKIITRPGSEKIIRYAFEYAKANDRKKVTCFTKDNILKITDGLFHKIFDEIAAEYPEIEHEHWIVDIGAAKLADTPLAFDVVVMPNLYGDILSDVAAQIAGSVGLAGSANIGRDSAMFEAIHGSAPRRAGQNLANPSGLLQAAILMLVHIGLPDLASLIHNAWLKTLEEGIHTYDIYDDKISAAKVGTSEFADAIIERLGQKPTLLKQTYYGSMKKIETKEQLSQVKMAKTIVGIDVYIENSVSVENLYHSLEKIPMTLFKLDMIANRGVQVWPEKAPETLCVDCWRCRFMARSKEGVSHREVAELMVELADGGIDFVKTEQLCTFNDKAGYSGAKLNAP